MTWWSDVEDAIRARAGGETVGVAYERGGVRPRPRRSRSRAARSRTSSASRSRSAGRASSTPARRDARDRVVGVARARGRAALGRRRRGRERRARRDLGRVRGGLRRGAGGEVQLALRRSEPIAPGAPRPRIPRTHPPRAARSTVPALGSVEALGVLPATVLVSTVTAGSAADEGGLAAGRPDRLGRRRAARQLRLVRARSCARATAARSRSVRARRRAPLGDDLARGSRSTTRALGVKEPRYLVGITPQRWRACPARRDSTASAIRSSRCRARSRMTLEVTRELHRGSRKIVTGEVSRKQLAGPIGIAEIAGQRLPGAAGRPTSRSSCSSASTSGS